MTGEHSPFTLRDELTLFENKNPEANIFDPKIMRMGSKKGYTMRNYLVCFVLFVESG